MSPTRISPSRFATAFQRLERDIGAYTGSEEPFSFQSGLPARWERYKEWLYYEGQRQLDWNSWTAKAIGSGDILERTIRAIEIHQDKNHRNNIVAWDGRHGGAKSKSHRKLLLARTDAALRVSIEGALFQMYAEEGEPETCFGDLKQLLGGRYDLISYLFFIRDWLQFLPLRSSVFPRAFAELGVPLEMSLQCSWENYTAFLERMREVQGHLARYDLPGGVRFIDAHSFCWMLASKHLQSSSKPRDAAVSTIVPKSAQGTAASRVGADNLTQAELDANLLRQKRIGDLAQAIVLRAERKRLRDEGRADLAEFVEDVSQNLSLGYDIASFATDGSPKPIEVKAAAARSDSLRFFVTENEWTQSQSVGNYTFALVLGVESSKPTILEFAGDTLPAESLRPIAYEVRLKNPMGTGKMALEVGSERCYAR